MLSDQSAHPMLSLLRSLEKATPTTRPRCSAGASAPSVQAQSDDERKHAKLSEPECR